MAGNFALDISRFVGKANGNIDLVVRKVVLDIFTRVIRRTPVDTGRARGNWMSSVSTMVLEETGVLDKTGANTTSKVTAVAQDAKGGDIIYLTNTLPYIMRLEDGSSTQAPNGMVSLTVQEYPGVVQKAASEVNR